VNDLIKSPFFVFAISFCVMCLSARIGAALRKRQPNLDEDLRKDLDVIVAGALTLLSLIIGFSFSMAVSRYDQRKIYEEAEANAIGTEYVRAGLLPAAEAARARVLLRDYLDQRVLFYETRDENQLRQINYETARLQTELWSAVQSPAAAQPTPVLVLALSGMNDVLNSQGYTQAAWWNRIPFGAWGLMAAIAVCSTLLVGYGRRRPEAGVSHAMVLPLILSIAFAFIADIDSPRRGVIRVRPHNLISLAQSVHTH
jgi:hypothetical protein